MKNHIPYIIVCFILMFAGGLDIHARQNNFDADICAIRNNAVPNFRFVYDDYMQYAPAAVMVGIKGFGYESRSSWGRMLVSDAFSTVIMAAAVNGLKYTVKRPRPDGSRNNSFPSGHTATSFMTATMLHREYGWRSPWFSIGAYTVASASAVSRLLNNKHWMTDLVGGAAIGIGSVHLGYYLTDLIFKEKGLSDSYLKPSFLYYSSEKHYVAELSFGQRLFIVSDKLKEDREAGFSLSRGGVVSLSSDIPLIPNIGLKFRISASSLVFPEEYSAQAPAIPYSMNMYSTSTGAYWNFYYSKRFEFQTHASAGAVWIPNISDLPGRNAAEVPVYHATDISSSLGAGISTGLAASFLLDSNFKLKLFVDYETVSPLSGRLWLHSIVLGWSSAWFW